jgi:hypothetical protein
MGEFLPSLSLYIGGKNPETLSDAAFLRSHSFEFQLSVGFVDSISVFKNSRCIANIRHALRLSLLFAGITAGAPTECVSWDGGRVRPEILRSLQLTGHVC